MKVRFLCMLAFAAVAGALRADSGVNARPAEGVLSEGQPVPVTLATPPEMPLCVDLGEQAEPALHSWVTPYALPYSTHVTGGQNWHRMWINTAALSGAFVATLFVLECLPEDATSWNRNSIQQTPLFQRWYKNIFVHSPEIDNDKFVFNYILHPYAGAAYYMSARSCGFSYWGSLLYSAAISTVCWEFGIEAFMERPSYQDIFITPIAGSILGEAFYRLKRAIVNRNFEVLGSPFLGHVICFLIDPVNEVIDLFRGSPTRQLVSRRKAAASFGITPSGLSLVINF